MIAATSARLDQIAAQAAHVDVGRAAGRAVLTVLAVLLWFVGAVPGAVVRALAWSAVAIRVGYRDGRGLDRPAPEGAPAPLVA